MINARPNLNGNSKADFFEAALALEAAINQAGAALGQMRANVFHGRNYQHFDDNARVREQDDAAVANASRSLATLQDLAMKVGQAASGDS